MRRALEAQDAEEGWTDEERRALSSHIEEGYLQAERGELIDGAQARLEIQAMHPSDERLCYDAARSPRLPCVVIPEATSRLSAQSIDQIVVTRGPTRGRTERVPGPERRSEPEDC